LTIAALFVFMGVVFGAAFPAIEVGLVDAPPLLFAALRFYLSALLLGACAAVVADWRPRVRADWGAVLAGGVFSIGGVGFLFVGQQYTTSGVAAIVYSLGPVFTVVCAWVFLPAERVSRRAAVGVVIGLVGTLLVVGPSPGGLASADFVGKALIVVATVTSVALGPVLIRRVGTRMPAVTLTAWALAIGAVLLHAGSLALGETQTVPTTHSFLAVVVYLGVVSSGVGFALYFWLLARTGPLYTNLVVYVEPVVAVLIGWLWLDETVSTLALVGFVVVVVGFVVVKYEAFAASVGDGHGQLMGGSGGAK
jgi:drug/metabolite transporter (DMT)-like permease